MQRLRIIGLALVAVFATTAVVAASASAAEYVYKVPCHKVLTGNVAESQFEDAACAKAKAGGGFDTRLLAGENKEIKSKAQTSFVLRGELLGVKSVTTCTALKLATTEPTPLIKGGIPGTSEEKVVFENCSGTLGGSACKLVTVENTPVNNEIVTVVLPAAKAGKLATLFTPKTGTVFTTIKLKECGIFGSTEGKVEGNSAALGSVGKAKAQTLTWVEGAEEITKVKKFGAGGEATVGLKFGGKVSSLEGVAAVELVSGEEWEVA